MATVSIPKMRHFSIAFGLSLTSLMLTVCGGANLPLMSVSQVNQGLKEGYRVGAGDKLRVTVFDEPTLTGDYEIGVGGDLSLPLLDAIPVGGMNVDAISKVVQEKLAEGGYVLAPRVSVEIVQHRPFFILGEVQTPGEYPYNGDLTLEQAVAKAGGYTPRADKNSIVLRRQDWTQSKRVKLDGMSLKVAPGDTITVQEAFF